MNMNKRDVYMEVLREEGYLPKLDTDGDIRFKKEGTEFWLFINEDDETYFQLVLPLFQVDEETEMGSTVAAASAVTGQIKAAKVLVTGSGLCVATIEQFLTSPSDLSVLLERYLSVLFAARLELGSELERLQEGSVAA